MPLDRTELLLTEALLRREDLVERTIERERSEADYYRAIRHLHHYGLPLRRIAREVRLSHQRVHQIVSNPTRTLERQRRRALPFKKGSPWSFSERAGAVLDRAESEARERGHSRLDLQDLLMGLLTTADGQLGPALARLQVDEPGVRAIEGSGHGDHSIPATRSVPIAARARVAVELARREADRVHSRQLEPEHLLVGVAMVGDALEASFLRDAGLTATRARAALSAT